MINRAFVVGVAKKEKKKKRRRKKEKSMQIFLATCAKCILEGQC